MISQTIDNLATISDTPECVGGDETNSSSRGRKFADPFISSYETSETSKEIKYPQDQSGYLELLSRSYTTEKPSKPNIKGVEIHLVKINNKGQMPAAPEGG